MLMSRLPVLVLTAEMRRGSLTIILAILMCLPSTGDTCKGRTLLTDKSGIISDGSEDYPNYARCEWLIDAQSPDKAIYLEFEFLNTECSYDFLFIFDGHSYTDPMLASLSGNNLPDPIIAKSGKMLVYLFSDRNYERIGFRARYSIQDCPNNCSNQGNCLHHKCLCFPGRTGQLCEIEQCPDDCGEHGQCVMTDDLSSSFCKCDLGYSGYMCNISLNDTEGGEYWYEVTPSGTGFAARSAHAGTLVPQNNCLYIFGGFTLNSVASDLKRFCFDINKWEDIPQSQPWPKGRYEHAIAQFGYGFFMFGGIMDDGSYSNELWYFNVTSEDWQLCAENSTVQPLKLSGHTLTVVENDIYLFGGKTFDGQFWSDMYKVSGSEPEEWHIVIPLGGKSSERRLVGHSTVYHKESKSLLIYGGYSHSQDQPRYGSHTNNLHLFHVENRIWSQIRYYIDGDGQNIPSQRSFHSAAIMGNYMIIYGGNTHIHHNLELCYDFDMYLYHLGCHTWVRIDHLMGKYTEERKTMKLQGRVSHVAVAAYGNILLIAGGYSGYVRGDLIAFKFPPYVVPPTSEAVLDLDFCVNYTRIDKCGYNPDCFYCNNITTTNKEGCMHRSQYELCRGTTNYYPKAVCPGICGRLSTCLECLSQGQGATLTDQSPERWTYIQPCNWCVKEGICQQRSKPEDTCSGSHNTVSGMPGWWGGTSASLSQIDQCRVQDYPAGLQSVKYRPSINMSQPDEVNIIRETEEGETFRHIYVKHGFWDRLHWMGFIHPLNATISRLINDSVIYTLKLVTENISVVVGLSRDANTSRTETVAEMSKTVAAGKPPFRKEFESRSDQSPLFLNRSRGNKYYLDVVGEHQYPRFSEQMSLGSQMYKVELEWNGMFLDGNTVRNYHPFSYEFLEPYSEGTCGKHTNCLACMTDALCGWCDPQNTCVLRNITDKGFMCGGTDMEKILITEPSVCPVCPDHVECRSCTQDPLCEWVKDYVYCVRRYRAKEDQVVREPEQCPASCHERSTCSECLNITECAWCENLHTCLPFSDYVSRHRHGQCTEWIDSEVANSNNPYTCRNCSALRKCDQCLETFSCGWCGNRVNPTLGMCFEGDFAGPYGNSTCSAIVSNVHLALNDTEPADWSYNMCPDVGECVLGIALCHPNATCTNTPSSYNCTCNRGFVGDGHDRCERTCYHTCVNGVCLDEDGEFLCDCDLGWTGVDCGTDCGCNRHSMCENGTRKCDFCLNSTTGPYCGQCLIGHFGDPTKADGCFECKCNKHGDESRGLCHNTTGECFCVDNTEGLRCESCKKGYYGDPREGGKCYLSCDHGLVIENISHGYVGSHAGPGVSTWRSYCLWILTVSKDINNPWLLKSPPTITFSIEDLAVECERDHVYVYDGIPEFIDTTGSGVLLGIFCGFQTRELQSVEARSGIVTVYFDADISGSVSTTQGFNGSYFVNRCPGSCDGARNQHCHEGQCVCKDGYRGYPNCTERSCDSGCRYVQESTSCVCESDFGAASYQITTYPWDANAIPTDFMGNGPVSRYGHVIIHCDNDFMYLFGGRSLEYGLLNDIWKYNLLRNTWMEIKPITNDQPSARYFHAGACVAITKNLYIFGGLVDKDDRLDEVANKGDVEVCRRPAEMEPDWVVGVAGHSMTLVNETKLVIIGGFSTSKYFSDTVYVYNVNSYRNHWDIQRPANVSGEKPTGIYGHTAVYNEPSKTIYIFGGHVYKDERLKVSDHLFTYDITDHSWNVLQPEPSSQLDKRYFHSAVGFVEYMVVLGGYTHHRNVSAQILIYKYKCNFWFTLDMSGTKAGKILTSLVSAAAIKYGDSIYIYGGINNTMHSEMYELRLPRDICTVHNTKQLCSSQLGCSAVIVRDAGGANMTHCYSSGGSVPTKAQGVFIAEDNGQQCNLNWHRERDCEQIMNCSECVATYPQFKNAKPSCFWCGNCLIGRCIPQGYVCESSNKCDMVRATTSNSQMSSLRSECPAVLCDAATCDRCVEMGCVWSQNFQRILTNHRGNVSRARSLSPMFDWSCVLLSQGTRMIGYNQNMSPPKQCPAPCYRHLDCTTCLNSSGGEGGAQECYWSLTLHECLPPAYLSLRCLGGECGTVLQGTEEKCPASCSVFTKCSDCRRAQGCGWCAYGGENGQGSCMPGTRNGPHQEGNCDLKNIAFKEKITDTDVLERAPSWTYATCPPEDECLNGHHSCDLETQDCHDDLDGFRCKCKMGYIKKEENGQDVCKPVCHQGCDNGECVKPDSCECSFGYVGTNCSTKCECNGHSMCESVQLKSYCLDCKNNTQGKYCESCKPLYVGDPKNGGRCVSCTEFCHNHTDICLYWTDYNRAKQQIDELLNNHPDTKSQEFTATFAKILHRGPETKNNTYCMDCQHHTHMQRCQQCQSGYFRLPHMTPEEPCMKCLCNGHSNLCDSNTGLNCHCTNNTETRCNADGKSEVKCHNLQCAECKEYFLGKPTSGHHCYRTMTVNRDYCFDPATQAECTRSPSPLHPGRTVFFAVQPKYVNVDIRVTIDVTIGSIDVYFSPRDDTFVVNVDDTGVHNVRLNTGGDDDTSPLRRRRSVIYANTSTPSGEVMVREVKARNINTFITVDQPDTILVIRKVQSRLVITLPNEKLDLKTSRFYMVFLSSENGINNKTMGNLYFRQDQPHIDLFVFFSVFFSCFFLFLAMCVLLWKTKQGFDARRTHQQRAREMLYMASRPFAKVLVLIDHAVIPYNVSPNLRNRNRKVNDRTPLLPSEINSPMSPLIRDTLHVVPIAIEPTDDGVAAVGTVVFQLPGGMTAPSRLCLGSTLSNQLSQTSTGKVRRPPASSTC